MKKKKLHICSFGLKPSDISIEAAQIIRNCAVVSDSLRSDNKLAEAAKSFSFARAFNDKGEKGDLEREIRKALKENGEAAYFTCGNPLFLNELHLGIMKKFSAEADIRLYPAVSSLDYVFQFIREKFLIDDFDCVCLMRPRFFPREYSYSPLLVFNPFSLLKDAGIMKKFCSIVRQYYPGSHKAYAIKLPAYPDYSCSLRKSSVKDIEKFLRKMSPEETLYLPGNFKNENCENDW